MIILFFDGFCNLCSFWVDWVIRRDRKALIHFASLQSSHASQILAQGGTAPMDTLVLVVGERKLQKSEAILEILRVLGGGWGWVSLLLRAVPLKLRDWVYDQVARNRYRMFGRSESCRVPTASERSRFLDDSYL